MSVAASRASSGGVPTEAYKNYLVGVLAVIFAFNNVDRLALGVVLQNIKIDLSLSDSQLGLLGGIAFALFYAIMGIPIGRWADRGNRVTIISLTAAIWSAAVALCGRAATFGQLLLIRVAVGVGEAGCVPPAHSLIADYFDRMERPRAIARYTLGAPLGFLLGYFGAGWLNQLYGWRMTFVLLGLPGLLLSGIAWLTLREPRRFGSAGIPHRESTQSPPGQTAPPLGQVLSVLWGNRSFRHLLFGISVWFFFGYGLIQWQPSFFVRSHGMQSGEVGSWFAVIYGGAGGLGMYLGGTLATRYAPGQEARQLRIGTLAFVFFAVITAVAFVASNKYVALSALALAAAGGSMAQGPLFAAVQTLVPARMRAMAIAIIYLCANLIGLGLGPLAAGLLSDALRPWVGQESLRYALLALCPGYLWAAWHLWKAGGTVVADIQTTERDEMEAPLTAASRD